MTKQFLSVAEVAEFFGISTDTVYRMLSDRELPYVPVRGQKKVNIKHLDGWVEKNEVKRAV